MGSIVKFTPKQPLKQFVSGANVRIRKQQRARLREIVLELIKDRFEHPHWEWKVDGVGTVIPAADITMKMFGDYPLDANHYYIWRWLWQTFENHDWLLIKAAWPEKLACLEAYCLTEYFMKTFYNRVRRPRTEEQIIGAIRHSGNKRGFGILICDTNHPLHQAIAKQGFETLMKAAETMNERIAIKQIEKLDHQALRKEKKNAE